MQAKQQALTCQQALIQVAPVAGAQVFTVVTGFPAITFLGLRAQRGHRVVKLVIQRGHAPGLPVEQRLTGEAGGHYFKHRIVAGLFHLGLLALFISHRDLLVERVDLSADDFTFTPRLVALQVPFLAPAPVHLGRIYLGRLALVHACLYTQHIAAGIDKATYFTPSDSHPGHIRQQIQAPGDHPQDARRVLEECRLTAQIHCQLLLHGNIFQVQRIIMLLTRKGRGSGVLQPAQGVLQRGHIGRMSFAHQGQQSALLGLLKHAQGIGVAALKYTLQIGAKLDHLLHRITRALEQHHKALRPQGLCTVCLHATCAISGLTCQLQRFGVRRGLE